MPSKNTRLRRRRERRRQRSNEQARAMRNEMAMRRRSLSTATVEEQSKTKQAESSRKNAAKPREAPNPVDMVHEAAVKAKAMKPKTVEGLKQPAKHVVAKVSIVVMAILVLLGMVITGIF